MSENKAKETPLGIPKAEFIDDIEAAAPTMEKANTLFQDKQEMLTKYRILEQHLIEKRQQLKANRPDVAGNLDAVKKVASQNYQNEPVTHFQLADGLYGTAKLKNDKTVALWLGANLMVEYPFDEAEELLSKNLENLDNQIAEVENNLVFLRDQIITTEVTVSRLTNQIINLQRKK
ncbi:prefoldin subunit 3 [Histomonas meleagridis]|uniref:prefoldin subunit 3 n=1 Tax=Histomonas meleagridis TaxID=135588 RepID=UPI00355944C2|nr:prefoldin subunit 3 [Histomonas meleagridis]KAH0796971.1 prefoldin subunit 3 [Histomonas meleagridis]